MADEDARLAELYMKGFRALSDEELARILPRARAVPFFCEHTAPCACRDEEDVDAG